MVNRTIHLGKTPLVGSDPGTTWNPADKVNLTLTGSDLIATTTGTTTAGIRTIKPVTTGQKKYWEMVLSGTDTAGNGAFETGVANISKDMSSGLMYSGFNSCGYSLSAGTPVFYVNFGGYTGGTAWVYADGDNVSFALDFAAQKAWVRVNGGNWNGAVIGSENPAGPTGGLDISGITGDLYPAYQNGAGFGTLVATAKFATSSWTYSAPSGFTQIDA